MTAAFGQLMRLPPKGIVAVSLYRKVDVMLMIHQRVAPQGLAFWNA